MVNYRLKFLSCLCCCRWQSPFQTGGCDSAASGGELSSLGRNSALNGQFFILILFVFSEWWWAD